MAKKQAEKTKEKPGGVPHIIGTVIGVLLILALLPLIACNVTLMIKSLLRPDKVPTFFGIAPLIVESGSMEDEILINDLIFVKQVDPDTLKVGDVVAFQPPTRGKKVITHRIIAISMESGRKQFTTKGDANNVADQEPVETYQVAGLYFARLAGMGKVAAFLQTTTGTILCVGIPMALFLLYDVLRRARYRRGVKYIDVEEYERLRAMAASGEIGPAQPGDGSAEE